MAVETRAFDPAAYIYTPEAAEEYLIADFETEDPTFIVASLGVVARARGMSRLAEETGLTRATLYKALSADGNPEFGTVLKVLKALGLGLSPRELAKALG